MEVKLLYMLYYVCLQYNEESINIIIQFANTLVKVNRPVVHVMRCHTCGDRCVT